MHLTHCPAAQVIKNKKKIKQEAFTVVKIVGFHQKRVRKQNYRTESIHYSKTTIASISKPTDKNIKLHMSILDPMCQKSLNASSVYGIPLFQETVVEKWIKIMLLPKRLNFKIDFLENCRMKFNSTTSAFSIDVISKRQWSATKMRHSGSFRLFDFSHPNWK